VWSLYNHHANANQSWHEALNDTPGRVGPPIEPPPDDILQYCSFEWMKKNAAKSVPLGGAFWDAGAEVFIHRGVNGRWMDSLSAEASADYEKRAESELGADCARWLATGEEVE
jgi:aryl sulfotransferase